VSVKDAAQMQRHAEGVIQSSCKGVRDSTTSAEDLNTENDYRPIFHGFGTYLTTYQNVHIRQLVFRNAEPSSTSCCTCTPATEGSTNTREKVGNDRIIIIIII